MRNIQLTNPSLDLRGIAQVLSDLRLPTTRGGASHATSVRNLLLRKSTNSGPDSILILESARQAETQGMNRFEAALAAARTRLRPILMTSFAFIFGVIPLAIAARAGAEMAAVARTGGVRRGLGVTLFGLLFTPVFYVHSRQVPLLFGLVTRPRRVP